MDSSNFVVYLPWEFLSWWFGGPWCCFGIPAATSRSTLGLASSLRDLLSRCQLNEVSTCWIWKLFSCSLTCWTQSTCKNLNEKRRKRNVYFRLKGRERICEYPFSGWTSRIQECKWKRFKVKRSCWCNVKMQYIIWIGRKMSNCSFDCHGPRMALWRVKQKQFRSE